MSQRRILVVDDETEFSSTLGKVLRRRGYAVETRSSGEAALAALEEAPFAVVVLDVKMPGMQGPEVLAAIKRAHPETQVILMTGHLSGGAEGDVPSTGAFAYLLKPYPIPDLIAIIDAAVAETPGAGG